MAAMPARKGPGSVRQRGNGYEFYLDERSYGRRGGQVRRGGYATEEDAALALALHRNQQRRSEHFIVAPYTLSAVAEAWIFQMQVKETTRERYGRDVRVHLEPTLGERPLDKVTTREIVGFFERLRISGGRGNPTRGQTLSYSSLCGIYTVLRQMYQWARPQSAGPTHGERRHLIEHAAFARRHDLKIGTIRDLIERGASPAAIRLEVSSPS